MDCFPLLLLPLNLPALHLYMYVCKFGNLPCWLIAGVSYLSRWQEDEALRRLNLRYEDELSEQARDVPLFSITDILFSERMKNRLREWRDGLLKDTSGGSQLEGSFLNDSNQQFQNIFYKMRPALSLNGFTSHQLRLIQSVMLLYLLLLSVADV